MEKCPVCLNNSEIVKLNNKDLWEVNCLNCTKFTITGILSKILLSQNEETKQWRKKLSESIRKFKCEKKLDSINIDKVIQYLMNKENISFY